MALEGGLPVEVSLSSLVIAASLATLATLGASLATMASLATLGESMDLLLKERRGLQGEVSLEV